MNSNLLKNKKIIFSIKIFIILFLVFFVIFIFAEKSQLTMLDLGRHIKNGEMVWQNADVFYKNFYSFTEPDFPFINHHWLSGVIFYLLYLVGGFKLLTLFNLLLALMVAAIIYYLTIKRSNFWLASFLILPVILILSERTDIRPEMFSYLFLAITFYLIDRFRFTNNYRYLIWLIGLQLVWINLHVYFFLGLFLISLLLLEYLIKLNKKFFKTDYAKKLFFITVGCYLISLVNPNFIEGLIYPLNILKEYGYEIVENKSPFFLENLMINYNIIIFKILVGVLIVSYLILLIYSYKKKKGWYKIIDFNLAMAIFFTVIAFMAIRNLPIFALMTLPIIAINLNEIKIKKLAKSYVFLPVLIIAFYLLVASWLIIDYQGEKRFLKNDFGLGLEAGSEDSIRFFRENELNGPMFNNYDLGSALIFWLYPREKVFVDNRPEAYSVSFFNNIYKPMMEEDIAWLEYSEKFNIKTIYISHTDSTPWARAFIRNRLLDPEWPLIFFDKYTLIMVKAEEKNQNLIEKYRVTNEKFIAKFKELSSSANIKDRLNLADFALLSGQNELAKEIYEEILTKQPNNGLVLALMGNIYANSNKKSDLVLSLNYYHQAIENGYILPIIYNQLGLTYWNLENYQEAKKMWQKALSLEKNNDHAEYYLNQANQLLK
ncbi:MAG: tetratricopeptide repeat protein [Patescibacteria group bacterium]